MVSLLEILQKSTDFLEKKGVEQARLSAEHLLAHALGLTRMELYLQFERPLTEKELEPMREGIRRRGLREPLQHILGTVDFCNLELKTDRRALIPRPETEELVELIGGLSGFRPERILDLGCGSGAIALGLAGHFPLAEVIGVDASPEALELAMENSRQLRGRSPVRFFQSDWFERVDGQFDCIVSNPPYLSRSEWESAQPEVKDFEPYSALVAEEGGYACLNFLIRKASSYLTTKGLMALETGSDQHEALSRLAVESGWGEVESRPDLSGRDRFLILKNLPSGR